MVKLLTAKNRLRKKYKNKAWFIGIKTKGSRLDVYVNPLSAREACNEVVLRYFNYKVDVCWGRYD